MGFFDIFKNGEFQDDGPFVYGCGVIWLIFSLFLLIFGGWLGVAIMVLNLLAVVSAIYESRSDQESYITSEDVKSLSGKLSSSEIEVLYLFLGINFNEPKTHGEVAKILGVSREQVIKIRLNAFKKLERIDLKGKDISEALKILNFKSDLLESVKKSEETQKEETNKDRELKFLESKKKFKEKKDLQSKTKNDLSFTDELDKLAKLREKNLLTEEEYRKAKRKIFKSFEN